MNIGVVELFLEVARPRTLVYEDVTGAFRLEVHRKLRHGFPVENPPEKIEIRVWIDGEAR